MACAAIKRTFDFDSDNGHCHKRQRCLQMCGSSNSAKQQENNTSPFAEVLPKMTREKIANCIREEIRRLQRHKQLSLHAAGHDSHSNEESSVDAMDLPASPSASPFAMSDYSGSNEELAFTFSQVVLICERMLKKRENQIREEYECVLDSKLSEQYEAFAKFTDDQTHKTFETSNLPSYLS